MIDAPANQLRMRLLLALLLVTGATLRWAQFPHNRQIPQADEIGYLSGSLTLLEGMTPAFKASPAGPTTWLGWAYAGAAAAGHFVLPGPEEQAVPLQVRPFVAVNHALFDLHRDYSGLRRFIATFNAILSLIAIVAAFRIGVERSGLAGGALVGGIVATLPMFVEYSCDARSYSTAWSFAIIAWYFAYAYQGRFRHFWAAVFLGFAIGSRVDMLVILPLIVWEFWFRPQPYRRIGASVRVAALSFLAAVLSAPWLLTNLIGNLRTIATIRFSPPPFTPPSFGDTIIDLAWTQALAPLLVIFIVGLVLVERGRRWRTWVPGIFALLLVAAVFKGSGYGLHHDAGSVIALVLISSLLVRNWEIRWPRVNAAIVTIALLLSLGQAIRFIGQNRAVYVTEHATEWIESHVPAGMRVYWCAESSLHSPLPTEASADFIWREVTDETSWRRKFQSGLARFNLDAASIPRALSEENLIQERSQRRMWFILGSRTQLPTPRYDLRLVNSSPIFGLHAKDLVDALHETSGVVVWRGSIKEAPAILGEPIVQWKGAQADDYFGIFIFAPPDVRAKLNLP